jgi:hypothetical protein
MGLGKTIQTLAYLAHLREAHSTRGEAPKFCSLNKPCPCPPPAAIPAAPPGSPLGPRVPPTPLRPPPRAGAQGSAGQLGKRGSAMGA